MSWSVAECQVIAAKVGLADPVRFDRAPLILGHLDKALIVSEWQGERVRGEQLTRVELDELVRAGEAVMLAPFPARAGTWVWVLSHMLQARIPEAARDLHRGIVQETSGPDGRRVLVVDERAVESKRTLWAEQCDRLAREALSGGRRRDAVAYAELAWDFDVIMSAQRTALLARAYDAEGRRDDANAVVAMGGNTYGRPFLDEVANQRREVRIGSPYSRPRYDAIVSSLLAKKTA